MSPGTPHVTNSPKANPPFQSTTPQNSIGDPLYGITNPEARDHLPHNISENQIWNSQCGPQGDPEMQSQPNPFWSKSKVGDGREVVTRIEVMLLEFF